MKLLKILVLVLLFSAPSLALDRTAFSFTKYDLRVTVDRHQHAIDVDGEIDVRNISKSPQSAIPLQISSSLGWRRITIGDQPASFISNSYTSDIDHTGALSEAVLSLAKPLAAGATITLSIHYGGTITKDATRLTRIGTPRNVALRSDWDEICDQFTAVRGAGYVTWYPVSIPAAELTNGDEVYDALAEWKAREDGGELKASVGVAEQATVIVNGATPPGCTGGGPTGHGWINCAAKTASRAADPAYLVIGAMQLDPPLRREWLNVWADRQHAQIARDYVNAAESALNVVKQTFGQPKQVATIIELADPDALPYETGTTLFVPLKPSAPAQLEVALARLMTHTCFDSPRAWVREGLATFAQALVRERQGGRKAALAYLNQFTEALSTAERGARSTATPQESSSKTDVPAIGPQPLITTNDELFYRTKAAFVWWMLRDIGGEDSINSFTSRYNREQDARDASYVQRTMQSIIGQRRDLEAFFDTWVYRDRGLAELRISAAYPREVLAGTQAGAANYIVAATVENTGDTWVEAPITVRTPRGERTERIAVEPHAKAVARVAFSGKPDEAIVNDGSLPEADVSDNRAELK